MYQKLQSLRVVSWTTRTVSRLPLDDVRCADWEGLSLVTSMRRVDALRDCRPVGPGEVRPGSAVVKVGAVLLQERDNGGGEHVVAISGDHVRGVSDIDVAGVGYGVE